MILLFDCDQFVLRTINNCSRFVEKIFISYSKYPWIYNKQARAHFSNTSNLELLKTSPHFSKLDIIEGIWNTEEDQRNTCLERAREEGFNYLIIQDADELYCQEQYKKNISGILENQDYAYYTTPWINFWKSLDYVLEFKDPGFGEKDTIYSRCANFAVNLKQETRFVRKRIINLTESVQHLSGICHHLSYVLSDQEVLRKISTWGHAHQVNVNNWYKWKWLAWQPSTTYLFPIISVTANRAVPYHGPLPEELSDFPVLQQEYQKLSCLETIKCSLSDFRDMYIFYLRKMVSRLKK